MQITTTLTDGALLIIPPKQSKGGGRNFIMARGKMG